MNPSPNKILPGANAVFSRTSAAGTETNAEIQAVAESNLPFIKPIGYLPTLDGWRAIAIFGVLAAHGMTTLFRPEGGFPNLRLQSYASHGAYGVPIFFSISGFLITYRLINECASRGRISLRDFYIRRFFRILPASSAFLFTLFILKWLGIIELAARPSLAAIFMVQNFTKTLPLYVGHFWSLSVEEQFYICWPALFWLLYLRGVRKALLASLFLGICGIVAADISHPFYGFAGIAFGCSCAFIYAHPDQRAFLLRLLTLPAWCCITFVVFLAVFEKIQIGSWLLPALTALMVTGTTLRPATLIGRALENRFLRWVGRCSYSIYLWQDLFCTSITPHPPLGIVQEFPLNFICTFAVAIPSFYLLEKPLIRLGHRLAPPVAPGRSDMKLRGSD